MDEGVRRRQRQLDAVRRRLSEQTRRAVVLHRISHRSCGTASGTVFLVSRALSIVVAVHDVEAWVADCLLSVAEHAPEDAEVIVVDDGSTDSSGVICDEVADGRVGWRVIHQSNAGLGAVRNLGMDLATGEYVGFIDGDDTLLPAYAQMLMAARRGGLDIATGAVQRTDGSRSWVSGLHARALGSLGDAATMTQSPSMVYDTTAWNKVYRRSFLQGHALRFPEGVLYEDLPFTIPALYFAGEVAIVHDPVYAWRTRQQGLSITQRRHEIRNLQDRFAAIWQVDDFLEAQGQHALRLAHDDKVLRLDLPLYTSALPEADEDYRTAYLTSFRRLVADLPLERRSALPPTLRLYLELAAAGRMDDLIAAAVVRRGPRAWAQDHRTLGQRARQAAAIHRVEMELGLISPSKVARRTLSNIVKPLLSPRLTRALNVMRRRPVTGSGSGGVRSGAGSLSHADEQSSETTQRQGKDQ